MAKKEVTAQQMEEEELLVVRESLRKAAEIKNPRYMWFAVRDALNLLTLIIEPIPRVIRPEDVAPH